MTYEQVVAKVKAKFADADASAVDGVVALQINLEGKNVNGIFYIEVKDKSVATSSIRRKIWPKFLISKVLQDDHPSLI